MNVRNSEAAVDTGRNTAITVRIEPFDAGQQHFTQEVRCRFASSSRKRHGSTGHNPTLSGVAVAMIQPAMLRSGNAVLGLSADRREFSFTSVTAIYAEDSSFCPADRQDSQMARQDILWYETFLAFNP